MGGHMRVPSQILNAVTKILAMVLFLSAASLALPDSIQRQARSQAKPTVKPTGPEDELAAFLTAPIDLVAFKKKKGPSNNGAFKASRWIYRPKRPGFFYQYMLFSTPREYRESERASGFSVVVYKFGKEVGDYYDTNEMLVAIWCRLSDPDLGHADLVGRLVPEIKARFGEPFAVVGDVLVYQRHGRALSVHTKDGAVDWFKYVWLSRNIDAPGAVPELLLQPNPGL
jgi:hypothetical protein